jgi:hypothetical protein
MCHRPSRRSCVVVARRSVAGTRASRSSASQVIACSRASLFRGKTRFEAGGIAGLLDRYRSVRASELPPEVERIVLTVRMLMYWNSYRIAAEFRRHEIWPPSHAQVDRLLARCGTHRVTARRVPGPRYERERANDL